MNTQNNYEYSSVNYLDKNVPKRELFKQLDDFYIEKRWREVDQNCFDNELLALNANINVKQVFWAIFEAKASAAEGLDRVNCKFVRACAHAIKTPLAILLNLFWCTGYTAAIVKLRALLPIAVLVEPVVKSSKAR